MPNSKDQTQCFNWNPRLKHSWQLTIDFPGASLVGSILNMTGHTRVSPVPSAPSLCHFMVANSNHSNNDYLLKKKEINARNRPHFRTNYLADAFPECRQPQRKIPFLCRSSHIHTASGAWKESISTPKRCCNSSLGGWCLLALDNEGHLFSIY